jgi:hypothetical protein
VPPLAALPTHPLWQYERNLQRMDANRSRAENIRRSAGLLGPARRAGDLRPLRPHKGSALLARCGRHIAPGFRRHRDRKGTTPPARDLPAAAEQIFDFSLVADVCEEDPSLV